MRPDRTWLRELLSSPWNPERYRDASRAWVVARPALTVTDDEINVLDMPIKLPGGPISLPPLPEWLVRLILQIELREREIHPDCRDMYSYLTVNQGIVRAGRSQRRGGAHFDGMQGVRYPTKLPPCHQYLFSTAAPTVFYEQPFHLSELDPARDNFFAACERQKRSEYALSARPGEVLMTTAYTVHESPAVTTDTPRTFVRVEFSHKRADREGNSLNPALDTSDWDYRPRPIPAGLQ